MASDPATLVSSGTQIVLADWLNWAAQSIINVGINLTERDFVSNLIFVKVEA